MACLSQLLSSFFLILGPIGVPVNALITDDDELDATQVSRRAAFRILSALQMIQPFQTRLKKDALVILQKFVSMCKSESAASGLPAVIASRQKKLLVKLLNSASKVVDTISGDN
jgi:chemotaxis regulatin CheY-phosphate phosphatase CheZ